MNLQAERIDSYCRQLKLDGLAERFEAIASDAAEQDCSFLDIGVIGNCKLTQVGTLKIDTPR